MPATEKGTRFRLYSRSPIAYPDTSPETIHISTPPWRMRPGPADDGIYVLEPIGKAFPYGLRMSAYGTPYLDLPPWRGEICQPAYPDADGHFDHVPVTSPAFQPVHLFGSVRFTLDVWEKYFDHPLQWHFAHDFDRLEILLTPELNNAVVGYGFMEVGAQHERDGKVLPFALNFDVIAHEVGHLITYGTIGVPRRDKIRGEYFGFHEALADIFAIIAVAHFDSLISSLMAETSGNLYSYNELDRFAELSATRQIRLASNSLKMSDFVDGWHDEHALSQPLTGALFDIFVDIYQEGLITRGLITRELAELTDTVREHPENLSGIQSAFDRAYPGNEAGFRAAFIEARDYSGKVLAQAFELLAPDSLTYEDFAVLLMMLDRELTGGRFKKAMIESFLWREIGQVEIGPRIATKSNASHAFSVRTLTPVEPGWLPQMTFRERMQVASLARNQPKREEISHARNIT